MEFDVTEKIPTGEILNAGPKGKMLLPTIGSIKKTLAKFDQELAEVERKVEALEITDDESMAVMIETGTQSKEILKSIENTVANRVGHIKKLIQQINVLVRYYKDKITNIQGIAKLKIGKWQREQEIARQEAAIKQQEEINAVNANLKKDAEERGLFAPKEIVAPVLEEQKTIRTSSGAKATSVKTWVFEVVSMKEVAKAVVEEKVPSSFIQINHVVINQAIKQGTRQIPGLKIHQRESTRF